MYFKMREYYNKLYKDKLPINVIKKSDLSPCVALLDDLKNEYKDVSNIKDINKWLSNSRSAITIVNLFPNNCQNNINNEPCITVQNASHIYYTGGSILFQDKYSSTHVDHVSDIPTIKKIVELLNEYRYINYTLNISKNKKSSVVDSLYIIINNILNGIFSNELSLYLKHRDKNALLDVMSISFYRLPDVIPIFDATRLEGIMIEFAIVNSVLSWEEALKNNLYFQSRIAYSKYRDNLLVVDGEMIINQKQISSSNVLDIVADTIYKNSPNDLYLKKKKEKQLCAE